MGLESYIKENGFLTTQLNAIIGWARKNSVWPMPMGISCCAIEMMAAGDPKYDIARFGSEVMRFTPRQCDLMIVAGTVTYKMSHVVRKIYDQMPEPKWVIAMGACTSSGGMYRSYSVVQGIDQFLPVDIYLAGCPPRPDNLLNALIMIQDKIGKTKASQFQNITIEDEGIKVPELNVLTKQLIAMNLKELIPQKLKEKFPSVEFEQTEYRDELSIKFEKKYIVEVCRFLKSEADLEFTWCSDVTAIDWAARKDRFTVIYNIFSMKHNFRLRLKCDVDEADCSIDSVTSIWQAANWQERETFDMYGIKFNNHPDLRRMYMPEEFEYYPLRKDFPLMGIPGSLSLPKK